MGTSWYHTVCGGCGEQIDPYDSDAEKCDRDSDDDDYVEPGECKICERYLCIDCVSSKKTLCRLCEKDEEIKLLKKEIEEFKSKQEEKEEKKECKRKAK